MIKYTVTLLFLVLLSGCDKFELHVFSVYESKIALEVEDMELTVSISDNKKNNNSNYFFYRVSRATKPYRIIIGGTTDNSNYYLLHVDSVYVQFAGGDVETYGAKEIEFKKGELKSHYTDRADGSFKINKDGVIFANVYYDNAVNQYEDCVVTVKGYIQSDSIKNHFSIKANARYGFNERWEFGPRN